MFQKPYQQTREYASRFGTHRYGAMFHYVLAAAFCLTLAACSGGGSGGATGTVTHTVTATAGVGGTITPSSATVNDGSTTSFSVTPDSGYATSSVTGCGGTLSGTTYTTGAITADCTVTASFTAIHTVTATAGTGGTITPSSATVNDGSATSFSVTPNVGYAISSVTGCGGTLSGTTYTTGAITADCTVTASFIAIHTVTATAGTGGTITPSSATVNDGSTTSFTVTPDVGYAIGSVTGCGGTLSGSTYTTGAITADCTVTASFTAVNQWTWMGGSNTVDATGVYGTLSTPAAANIPGAREYAATWTDTSGRLWLFGGSGYDSTGTFGYLNDLWQYDPTTNLWTWMGGSKTTNALGVYGSLGTGDSTTIPGARDSAATWTDANGRLWLFGGNGYDSAGSQNKLNDLWQYDPTTKLWTWIGGSNTVNATGVYGTLGTAANTNIPGARIGTAAWTDATTGLLWLFGGRGWDSASGLGQLNDLWQYDVGTGQWTWVSGSDIVNALGVYGTLGTGDSTTTPGARSYTAAWTDASGHLWLFGGFGYGTTTSLSYLNDLWQYDLSTGQWTWMAGSNNTNAWGVYGTLGTGDSTTTPGARDSAAYWSDSNSSLLWLVGGYGRDSVGTVGDINDLWKYDLTTNQWTWVGGSNTANAIGVYGTQGTSDVANIPGARDSAAHWVDANGHLWLFGGYGYDSAGNTGDLNDLWLYQP